MSNDHVVTATEPAWTEAEYRPNDDGVPEYVGDSTKIGDLIDGLADHCEYECSCGFETNDWFEVEEHFAEVTHDGAS